MNRIDTDFNRTTCGELRELIRMAAATQCGLGNYPAFTRTTFGEWRSLLENLAASQCVEDWEYTQLQVQHHLESFDKPDIHRQHPYAKEARRIRLMLKIRTRQRDQWFKNATQKGIARNRRKSP